ncbi:hypothetical protein LOK55_00755 [Microbacterium sp. F2E]|uniref:hypothetical protein n=1 Tax=Microbacterium sp. F2E TaxID=2895284 RepID=UPI001E38DDCF|nr:hypothetical protein [Microbacterium sp. F2E]MCC9052854.1 hypothetical protein [Microbacterium sp. F2E]
MSGRPTSTARILTGVLGAAAVALGVFLALRSLTPPADSVDDLPRRCGHRPDRRCRRRRGEPRRGGARVALAGCGAAAVRLGRRRGYTWTEPVAAEPGALLRVGAYDGEVPVGSTALRILYATERVDGSPAVASAVVALPSAPAPSGGRTTLAWQHGTTGVARACAPSLETNALSEYARSASPRPPVSGATIAQRRVLATAPHHRNGTPETARAVGEHVPAGVGARGAEDEEECERRHQTLRSGGGRDGRGPPGFCPVR